MSKEALVRKDSEESLIDFLCPKGVKIGGRYIHFKGGVYTVTSLSLLVTDDTNKVLVNYTNGDEQFARTIEDFFAHMERGEYVGPRFTLDLSDFRH